MGAPSKVGGKSWRETEPINSYVIIALNLWLHTIHSYTQIHTTFTFTHYVEDRSKQGDDHDAIPNTPVPREPLPDVHIQYYEGSHRSNIRTSSYLYSSRGSYCLSLRNIQIHRSQT
jgi:hypothetical protein